LNPAMAVDLFANIVTWPLSVGASDFPTRCSSARNRCASSRSAGEGA